jgi:hypothetical protein
MRFQGDRHIIVTCHQNNRTICHSLDRTLHPLANLPDAKPSAQLSSRVKVDLSDAQEGLIEYAAV